MARGQVLFVGTDAANHDNLWVTDGTTGDTTELMVAGAYSFGLFNSASPDFTVFGGEALFAGQDSNGRINLWVSDGTLAGTAELTVAGAYAGGLQPSHFTVLGARVLFAGYDTNAHYDLWITDGTSAGTSELNVAGAAPSLIYTALDPDFTLFGSKVLFAGVDASSHRSLWATDGTVAGTSEIQVAGASSGGLFGYSFSPDLTLLGSRALFEGIDANGHYGLWVTDGTTAGTSELTSPAEYSFGFFYSQVSPDFTVLSSGKALFEGNDVITHFNLWVTDGTSSGTSELMVAGADPNGLFYFDNQSNTQNPDFTAFGTRALFKGEDSSAKINLWITDGTSAGTTELTAAGAGSHGLFSNGTIQVSPDFTTLGGRALFAGFDANGHVNLWVTDGTSAGTSELIVAGADPSGLFFNNGNAALNPQFTVLGSEALFDGYDVNGHLDLWATDGTAAGTVELAAAGANSSGLAASDVTVLRAPTPNADLLWQTDGTSIFLQNDSGPAVIWTVSGTAFVGGGSLPNPGSSWHAKAPGDFNGDGKPDILWQDDSGAAAVWLLNAATVIGGGSLPNPGPGWQVATVGDFNGDGRSDILWQNGSGEVAIWALNGAAVIGGGSLGNPGASWHAVGSGDFNGDKKSDILWQNDSGQVAVWELNGTSLVGGGNVANPGPSWHALGAGDFNGDSLSDIVLQNDNGQVAIWELNGSSIIGGGTVANPGPSWHVMGVGDYNSDGRSDILLQSSSGEVAIWEMNGTSIIGGGSIANPGPTWHV